MSHSTPAARPRLEDFLLARSATSPVWRSDDALCYLSNEPGTFQVFEIDVATGVSRQRTSFAEPVQMLVTGGQTERLAFGVDVGGNERHQVWTQDGDDPAQRRTSEDDVIHQSPVLSADGRWVAYASNSRARQFFDVWVTNLDDGTSRVAWAVDGWLAPLAWSADASRLLVRRSLSSLDHDLYDLNVNTGAAELLTPHDGESTVAAAAFDARDGSVLIATNQDHDLARLVRRDPTTGAMTVLVEDLWDVEAFSASPDGATIAVVINDDGGSSLALLDAASGRRRGVDGVPMGVVSGVGWSPDGTRLAFAATSSAVPSAIWVHGIGGATRPLVRVGAGGGTTTPSGMSEPETVRFRSFDGLEIPAFWLTPKGGGGPGPVVVDVHGGPESQRRRDYLPFNQFLVDRGFAVLSPNVRGSTGYGKHYTHLDDRELRMDSVADLAAAVEWLRTQPNVDPNRIAVLGRSYGGFMVLAALTSYPDIWAAGVDFVGIADFESFFERTGPWRREMRASEYGDPQTQAELLRRISPLHRAEAITAPLIVLHGRNDPRVPVEEAEQIVDRLRALDRDVELVVFEDEGHVFGKESNQIAAYRAIVGFLERVMG